MNILISIKPEFVSKILAHEKLYEFRKSIFKQNVDKIFIYSSYPEKKIVGYFKARKIICKPPAELWNLYSESAGICKKDFFKYYANTHEGFAIKIDNLHIFDEFIDMNDYDNFTAPQSFCYIENNECLKELLLM